MVCQHGLKVILYLHAGKGVHCKSINSSIVSIGLRFVTWGLVKSHLSLHISIRSHQ